jgi:hypothetical protein
MADGPDRHPILAADADRERSVALLREAVAEGRLTLDEFSDRVTQAQVARTEQDLSALVRDLPPAPVVAAPIPAQSRHSAVGSRLVRQGHWELAPRSAYRSIFGTIDLDLRQATLPGGDAELHVFSLFGTVTVIVPEGIAVSVEGGGLFASQVVDPPAAPPVAGAPRLRIVVSGPGGTLHVRSQPARKSLLGSVGKWGR